MQAGLFQQMWRYQPVYEHFWNLVSVFHSCLSLSSQFSIVIFCCYTKELLFLLRCSHSLCKHIVISLTLLLLLFALSFGDSTLIEVKVKCTLVQALRLCTGRTAHRRSRGIALLFHNHGTRRGWGISVTRRPLFIPREKPGTDSTRGWLGTRGGLDRCGKSRPHRDKIPGPPSS
jgi:hypothetical protein